MTWEACAWIGMSCTIVATRYTLDTNILIYAADRGAPADKRRQSQGLIRAGAQSRQPLALQSLHEFCHVVTRKRLLPLGVLSDLVYEYSHSFHLIASDESALFSTLALHERTRSSYFDCLLLVTAAHAGCAIFFSEDMQDGFSVEGMQIVDPFKRTDAEVEALLQS